MNYVEISVQLICLCYVLTFGSFMIIRPGLFKCDWSLFSIWNGVIVNNQTVWVKSGISLG